MRPQLYLAITFITAYTICSNIAVAQKPQLAPNERSYQAIEEYYRQTLQEHPDRRNKKLIQRDLYHLRSHLNDKGEVFNNTYANFQALEELYIDTLPGTIQGDWQSIGPLNIVGTDLHSSEGMGRVNCVEFANGATWYAGTAGGGLWKTDVAGIYVPGGPFPWYPLTDNLPTLAISGIVANPSDTDELFILTGDGEGGRGQMRTRGNQPGIGILHSEDGGTNWDTTSLQFTYSDRNGGFKLVRYPGAVDTMFAGCTDSLYRTTDGWQTHTGVVAGRCFDIEFKPGDPSTVYAGVSGTLLRSTDGGQAFTDITSNLSGFPLANAGRIELAVSPDNPQILYVVIAIDNSGAANDDGLLTCQYSLDGGNTFIETTDNDFNILASRDPVDERDGQGNYDLAIWSNPTDAETILVGGVNIWKSAAFGLSWFKVADWEDDPPGYVHADVHDIVTNPANNDIVVCTDGGIYSSSNGGSSWENRSRGLGITQYYHFDAYTEFLGLPFVGGGTQDNGTNAGVGFNDDTFEDIQGGDGFRYYRGAYDGYPVRYGSIQNGKLFRQTYIEPFDAWDNDIITPDDQEDDDGAGLGPWDTPYQPNPNLFSELVAGYDKLYFYNGSWGTINFPAGYSYGSSNAILELEWAPSNTNTVYFYTQDGTERDLYKVEQLYLGILLGQLDAVTTTVVSLDDVPSMPSGPASDISDIFLNPNNDTTVWVTFYSYFGGQKVYYNENIAADSQWFNITYNLPNVPVHCGVWDVDGIYIGSDIGVFFLPHGESQWIYFSEGLPTASVTELQIENTILGRRIFASTYGRGLWYSTLAVPPRRTRWYVDKNAAGLNNGSSWQNAFTDLQDGLDVALPGDSVWIAEATYYPGTINGFTIQNSDVRVYGAFNSGDTSMSQRHFILNRTILSGDIGIEDDSTDNAYHVLRLTDQNNGVLIDGLEIMDGNARGSGINAYGGGILITSFNGGTKPLISNCQIERNTALQFGGGVYVGGFNPNGIPMKFRKCRWANNYAGSSGGGVYIDAFDNFFPFDTGTAAVYFDTCVIEFNDAYLGGGGMFMEGINASNLLVKFDSVTFTLNKIVLQGRKGGAIHVDLGSGATLDMEVDRGDFSAHNTGGNSQGGSIYVDCTGSDATIDLKHCKFENSIAANGGALFVNAPTSGSSAVLNIDHCSFEQDSAYSGGALYYFCRNWAQGQATISNTLFNENKAGQRGGCIHFDGDTGGQFIIDIDSCDFTNNQANENAAIRFLSRTTNGVIATMDLSITNSSFSDNTAGSSTNGGALGLNSDHSQFDALIQNTDFINNFSGNRGGAIMHTQSGYPDTSYLNVTYDNCTFVGNSTLISGGASGGGAMAFENATPTVQNCVFDNNEGYNGGAIFNKCAFYDRSFNQVFSNNQFLHNHGYNSGGAIYNEHTSPTVMSVDIGSCVFDSNYTSMVFSNTGRGGAFFTIGDGRVTHQINGSEFLNNVASRDGGAMMLLNFSSVDTMFVNVDSCMFSNNIANSTGETVEQAALGVSAKVISNWSNSDFYTAGVSTVFLNRRTSTGLSIVNMSNCGLYQGLPEESNSIPLPAIGAVRTSITRKN